MVAGRCAFRSTPRRPSANGTSLCQTAQTIRPSLLATAIVALLWPRRALHGQRPLVQPRQRLGLARCRRCAATSTARAPCVSKQRRYTSPCLLMPPRRRRGAAGMFTRRQSEPARKLTRPSKRVNVPHGPDERRRRQQPNARNRPQAHHDRIGVGESAQLALECRDPCLDRADFLMDARQNLAQMPRQRRVSSLQDRRVRPAAPPARRRAAGSRARAESRGAY